MYSSKPSENSGMYSKHAKLNLEKAEVDMCGLHFQQHLPKEDFMSLQ